MFTKNIPPLRVGTDFTVPRRMGTLATAEFEFTKVIACCMTC